MKKQKIIPLLRKLYCEKNKNAEKNSFEKNSKNILIFLFF